MSTKTIKILLAVLPTLAAALLALEQLVSPAWGLLIAAVGTGIYGIVRALQKVAAGVPLKSLLVSTEDWGAALVLVAAIVSAIAGLVSPEQAGGLIAIAGVLRQVSRTLQAKLGDQAQSPEPRRPDAGVVEVIVMLFFAAFLAGGAIVVGGGIHHMHELSQQGR